MTQAKAPRGGRRMNAPAGRREHVVQIKLSGDEFVQIESLARAMQCSKPRVFTSAVASSGAVFGRVAALQSKNLVAGLAATNRMLAGATNNLNQIARGVNTDGTVDATALAATLDTIRDCCADVQKLITEAYPE